MEPISTKRYQQHWSRSMCESLPQGGWFHGEWFRGLRVRIRIRVTCKFVGSYLLQPCTRDAAAGHITLFPCDFHLRNSQTSDLHIQ